MRPTLHHRNTCREKSFGPLRFRGGREMMGPTQPWNRRRPAANESEPAYGEHDPAAEIARPRQAVRCSGLAARVLRSPMSAALLLLRMIGECRDPAVDAMAAIRRTGSCVDRVGARAPAHPAADRRFVMPERGTAGAPQLHLDVEPLKGIGRPGGFVMPTKRTRFAATHREDSPTSRSWISCSWDRPRTIPFWNSCIGPRTCSHSSWITKSSSAPNSPGDDCPANPGSYSVMPAGFAGRAASIRAARDGRDWSGGDRVAARGPQRAADRSFASMSAGDGTPPGWTRHVGVGCGGRGSGIPICRVLHRAAPAWWPRSGSPGVSGIRHLFGAAFQGTTRRRRTRGLLSPVRKRTMAISVSGCKADAIGRELIEALRDLIVEVRDLRADLRNQYRPRPTGRETALVRLAAAVGDRAFSARKRSGARTVGPRLAAAFTVAGLAARQLGVFFQYIEGRTIPACARTARPG